MSIAFHSNFYCNTACQLLKCYFSLEKVSDSVVFLIVYVFPPPERISFADFGWNPALHFPGGAGKIAPSETEIRAERFPRPVRFFERRLLAQGGLIIDEFGPTFITVTSEDGEELTLEFIGALELNGTEYQAFFPTESEDDEALEDPDSGLIIMKVIHENGEDLLSTCDTDEELQAAYEAFMEELYDDEEDGE